MREWLIEVAIINHVISCERRPKKKQQMTWLLTKAVGNDFYLRRWFAEMVIAIIKQNSLKANWHLKDRFPSCLILDILDIDVFIHLGDVCK